MHIYSKFCLPRRGTLRGLSLLPLAWIKQPNPERQWDIESSSSTEQQQPQAEATTLLHESPNSKPETIEQRKIVFHYIRVWVAWMRVVPLIRAKPIKGKSTETDMSAQSREQCVPWCRLNST